MIIDGKEIGLGHPPYMIAEMSGNHNQSIDRAFQLITAAKNAGADAVKIQTYTPDTITLNHDGPGFIASGLWEGRKLYELYAEAMTPWEWHADLFNHARSEDITIFSSPFDNTAVDLLEKLDAPAYKIASFEIVDIPLIKYAASTGKPIIISSGLANLDEMKEARDAVFETGNKNIILLHCVSGYPALVSDCNLATIPDMASRLSVDIGLSDHTHGTEVPVAATALGACVIEKHMTLRRADGGVDSEFSLEPQEFRIMTDACRNTFSAVGQANYSIKTSEEKNKTYRRSLYASADISTGEELTQYNVKSVRPSHGLHPRYYDKIIGCKAKAAIKFGTPLSLELLSLDKDFANE
jgi:N-acetylneuraminate synthase